MTVLPKLTYKQEIAPSYKIFLKKLKKNHFKGDIHVDMASRLAVATDNSVYQVTPQVVLFPKGKEDIVKIFTLASKDEFKEITFSPRGGGTGTNGQSLSDGIIIDHSRYLNQIGTLNLEAGSIEVEPGVVLDQLNQYLAPYGVFFPLSISPSDRATLGGMCNTDACGKGSIRYGRTSENLLELECVLMDGSVMLTKQIDMHDLNELKSVNNQIGTIYRTVDDILFHHKEEITRIFPKLKRFMTGYNLAMVYNETNETFNLNYLLSGSEGTLAYITKLKLKLSPIAKHKVLYAIQYTSFDRALRAARELLPFEPSAIETIDDMILMLAKDDESYHKIKPLLQRNKKNDITPRGLNLVEFIKDSKEELESFVQKVTENLQKISQDDDCIISFFATDVSSEMNALWDLRKKSVGLLANLPGWQKPVAFMEDTVVPPEKLADFIMALRKLLDDYSLRYGMFGHVDVGCLHMRPALDMTDSNDQKKLIEITQKVSQLVRQYGGVYWGEHGKGFRSELTKDYFGETLTNDLAKIKKAFDPDNKLNPGKIATPEGSHHKLVSVDGPFRGYLDHQINYDTRQLWGNIFSCNGNARCLNRDYNFSMCPSAKVSNNWVYSPKGRASLLREWTRLAVLQHYDFNKKPSKLSQLTKYLRGHQKDDFSYQVYQSMEKCLGCKACATSCPVQVNIPEHRSLFLHHYHTRYRRALKDHLIGRIESIAKWGAKAPKLFNLVFNNSLTAQIVKPIFHLADMPKLSQKKFKTELQRRKAPEFSLSALDRLSQQDKQKTVCLIPDAFTSFYEVETALAMYDALVKFGFRVYVLPFRPNGKALHVKGFLNHFKRLAYKNAEFYQTISEKGVDLIGIEPTLTLCYRDEYVKSLGKENIKFHVYLPQEWLLLKADLINYPVDQSKFQKPYYLFAHCTERALALTSQLQWQAFFTKLGLKLEIMEVGCCGMAGTYGHELAHQKNSHKLYQLSWKNKIERIDSEQILVSGYSCRSQIKRFSQVASKHPLAIF